MANFIKDLLQSLQPKPSVTIGVSLSQSGLLEVCTLDKSTDCIKKYANRTIKYNLQNREIESMEEFKTNIVSMYQELDIPNNCNVVLSMPNVFFELISVPLILDTYATEGVLLGEVEQSYIFKKNTPKLSWLELGQNSRSDNKLLAYAAIQQSVAEELIKAFSEIGSKLVAIDNSYYNLVNTIAHTQIAHHEIETLAPWNIVLVTNNSFVICSMSGDKLVEFYEEPLALRSISDETEIYATLATSINASLQNYMANSILVISDFENVDAAVLCDQLTFHGKKNYLNQNKYAAGQIVDTAPGILPDYISSITLYALGSVIYPYLEEGKRINLVVEEENAHKSDTYVIGNDLIVTEEMVQAFTIFMALLICGLYILLWFLFSSVNKTYEAKINDYQTKAERINQDMENMQKEESGTVQRSFDLTTAKKDIQFNNKQSILYYNLLSFNIPQSTWITHFYTDSKGAVAIEGKTSSTNNVYLFFKGIKATMENSDLALTKLKYADGFEEEAPYTNKNIYEFALTNSKYVATDIGTAVQNTVNTAKENLDDVKQTIQEKVTEQTKTVAPADLPPIEDMKTGNGSSSSVNNSSVGKKITTTSKTTTTTTTKGQVGPRDIVPRETQKLRQEDVEQMTKRREASGAIKSKNGNNSAPELPELPNLED